MADESERAVQAGAGAAGKVRQAGKAGGMKERGSGQVHVHMFARTVGNDLVCDGLWSGLQCAAP